MDSQSEDKNPLESLLELGRLALDAADSLNEPVQRASSLLVNCLRRSGKILICGNGGSAADAQHFASEIVGRFLFDRPALPAVTLSADTSVMTSVANDYGYEAVFSRQVEALGDEGDILVGFTTSGGSPNILRAIEAARAKKMKTIAMVGPETNPVLDACDLCIAIPSQSTPRIQEMHTAILHAICEIVEKEIFPK